MMMQVSAIRINESSTQGQEGNTPQGFIQDFVLERPPRLHFKHILTEN